MNHTRPSSDVSRFVVACPEDLREIVEELRRNARDALGGMREIVYHGAIGYSPTGKPSARVVYIAPRRGYVNLGFFHGTSLADPHRLLDGTGVHMRHVKVRDSSLAASTPVRALLVAAGQMTVRRR